jgi:hypothetical protein
MNRVIRYGERAEDVFMPVIGVLVLVGLGVAVVGGIAVNAPQIVSGIAGRMFPREEEAVVKWSDCRKVRYLDKRPALDLLTTYSCTYERSSEDGHIVGGQCVHVVEPMLGAGCEEARIYRVTERPIPKQ